MSRRPDRKPPWNGSSALVEGASYGVVDVQSSLMPKPTAAPHIIFGCTVLITTRTSSDSLALYECCEVHDLACRIPPLMTYELAAPRFFGEASTVLADLRSQRPLTNARVRLSSRGWTTIKTTKTTRTTTELNHCDSALSLQHRPVVGVSEPHLGLVLFLCAVLPSSAHLVFCAFASNGPREFPASPPDRPRPQTCATLCAESLRRRAAAQVLHQHHDQGECYEFNDRLNPLRHYRFRRHFLDKSRILNKTLVLCSQTYTSRTWGRCCRLHPNLQGSADVFQFPHCEFRAGRDENAAFNIMRFVWAGSLSVFELNRVRQ